MHTLLKLTALAPLLLVTPVLAQDFLGPLQDMVDQLTQDNDRPQRPQNPTAQPADIAPVPRPRPPDLPTVPGTTPPVEGLEPEEEAAPAEAAETVAPAPAPAEVETPVAEPGRAYQVACPAVLMGLVEAEMAPPLSDGICGERSPLVVTAVMSRGRMLPLSTPVTTNCQMATALPRWVETVDGYAEAMLESPLASIETSTSYMCRNRNAADAGLTSEHGFANALDITGFTLQDGRSIGVEGDWAKATAPEGRLLRLAHDAACSSFTTVLGPEANAEHADHLHLDLGCHGQTCRAQICE